MGTCLLILAAPIVPSDKFCISDLICQRRPTAEKINAVSQMTHGVLGMNTEYFFELFFSGLTRGSIYALIALGYTMVYGIISLINFAHGEIYMIGAFTGLIVAGVLTLAGLNTIAILVIASIAAVVYSSAYGWTMEKIAYKPLRNAPRLSALISAIGMSLFLQNYVLLAQTSDFLPFPNLIPDFKFLKPFEQIVRSSEFVIYLTAAIVMVLLTLMIKFTRMGKAMRATAQDREMAMLVGVDVDNVISITFVVGSAIAAIGGILIASHIGQINFHIGFIVGIKAFVAAVLGGIGSLPGAVLGGLVLGWTESFFTGYISSDYEDVFAFLILVFILIFKPSGILGRKKTYKVL
jgi:branched-chain amino acid transport system permease protein